MQKKKKCNIPAMKKIMFCINKFHFIWEFHKNVFFFFAWKNKPDLKNNIW